MYLLILLLNLCICLVTSTAIEPIAHTNFGVVRGKWLKSARNLPIAAYLGIPYAEQPVGQLRFKNPQPWTEQWENVRDALEDGPVCPQPDKYGGIMGSEDCLHLNIFVPSTDDDRELSVLVFVHGGSFIIGSNNSTYYSPEYLADQGIILVTVNYRLGILGFLSTGNKASPGNYGVKDVFEALKWIQGNIRYFGGDPSSVTISGVSAGSALVHHLALSKRTEGFFDKIITHSGSATSPWAIHPPKLARIRFITVAIQMGCATTQKMIDFQYTLDEDRISDISQDITENDYDILDCLRKASADNLTLELDYFKIVLDQHPTCNFGPTIEPEAEDALITDHPESIIEKKKFRDIPWIGGVTSDEGLVLTMNLFVRPNSLYYLKMNFEEIVPSLLEMEEVVIDNTYFSDTLMSFYFPDGFDPDGNDTKLNLTAMAGDAAIIYWAYSSLKKQAQVMNSSVYFYQFSYEGTFSTTFSDDLSRRYGVAHGDDMTYLFATLNNLHVDLQLFNTLDDKTMINLMSEYWSTFVKSGIPSASLAPVWEPYQENCRFMRLGNGSSSDISMENDFLTTRMEFWESLMKNASIPREQLFFGNDIGDQNETDDAAPSYTKISITNLILLCVIYKLFH